MKSVSLSHNTEDTASIPPPVTVCMHVLGIVRTDVRVLREATALVDAGYAVSIVDIEGDSTRPGEEDIRGVRVKHIIKPSWYVPARFKPWFVVKLVLMMLRGTIRLLHTPADVYHAHDDLALPACMLAALIRRKPLIFDAHELPLSETKVTRWRRLHTLSTHLLAAIVPRCTAVITVSSPIAQEIRKRYHCQQVTLVRNVPPYQTVPVSNLLRERLDLPQTTRIALYQGAFQPNRGLDMLIAAAPFLEPGIMLVLMGSGESQPQLEALIARADVADRVKILPPVPYAELLTWSASADLGLIVYAPQHSLNVQMCLPNKLFEYLMAGVPILASQLDAVEEVITTHDVGQIVSSLAPEAVATAINTMLADSAALARMRNNALTIARHEFCWEKEGHQLIGLYEGVLPQAHAVPGTSKPSLISDTPSTLQQEKPVV